MGRGMGRGWDRSMVPGPHQGDTSLGDHYAFLKISKTQKAGCDRVGVSRVHEPCLSALSACGPTGQLTPPPPEYPPPGPNASTCASSQHVLHPSLPLETCNPTFTVRPKMDSCFQDGGCSVCFPLHCNLCLFGTLYPSQCLF